MLKVALDHADVQYADTEMLEMAISMVDKYYPADYKDFSGVEAAKAEAQALLNEKPTSDRQEEVDAAAMAIFDAIGALEWREGTLRNPIEYEYMMDVTAGLYYKYRNKNWLCLESKSPCLILPGTSSKVWEIA